MGSDFSKRCESIFLPRYGKRWKTACAHALGIARASLYRYLDEDVDPPDSVFRSLAVLEGNPRPVRDDREMVICYATALVDVQHRMDERGWLSTPYPSTLRRALDLGAARNFLEGDERWPANLASLVQSAEKRLRDWVSDLAWDKEDLYSSASLLFNGELTAECRALASPSGDPETELTENAGYLKLLALCGERDDGEIIYRTWRRCVIEHPTLENWSRLLLSAPEFAEINSLDELVEAFYEPLPESFAIEGRVPVCRTTGTVLRRRGLGFHTECRDREAIKLAFQGECDWISFRPGMLTLRRPFRIFWCLPGRSELELERRLIEAGWRVELWPRLDRVDIVARSSDGRRIAIDVKDYLSPVRLAARFKGLREYEEDHMCFLVIPDYVARQERAFEQKFDAFRASFARAQVHLRTVSDLLLELGVDR